MKNTQNSAFTIYKLWIMLCVWFEKPMEFDNGIAVTDFSKITVHIPAGWKSQSSY